jgi:hypothetical protein
MKMPRPRRLVAFALLLGAILATVGNRQKAAEETSNTAGVELAALQAAVKSNLDYCRQWLEEKDFKTLRQSAEGVSLLADVLEGRGDDAAWQESVKMLRRAASELAEAAEAKSSDGALDKLRRLGEAAESLAAARPAGMDHKPLKPSAPLASMMALLDGTHADAKRSLTFGEPATASQSGYTIAELGRLLGEYRDDEDWRALAGELVAAARALGESPAEPAAVRAALRGVYQRCEACHERKR